MAEIIGASDHDDDRACIEGVRGILIDAFKEAEPFAPVLVVREIDEAGRVAYVSRPMLPVAQTVESRQAVPDREMTIESIANVIDAVSRVTKYPSGSIKGPRRTTELVTVRHAAMYLAHEVVTPLPSYPELGEVFEKNHTSVMHAVKKIGTLLMSHEADTKVAAKRKFVDEIIKQAASLLRRPSEALDETEVESLVCLNRDGLIGYPLLDQLTVAATLPGDNVRLDGEHVAHEPGIYQKYADAALRLALNVKAQN
jgi:hypothetical protein